MLSPDTYVQSPNNTQSFNRYAYCWNNPLKYTDPSVEIIFTLATLIAAPLTGGASLSLLPYAIGADIGMWQGGTMANGTMNPTKWDLSSGKTWGYMADGAVIGAGSAYIGTAATGAIFKSTSIGVNHVLFGATNGAISGSISGFGMGGLSGIPQDGKWSWSNAWKGAGMGAAGGAIMGGLFTAAGNWISGRNIWSGNLKVKPTTFSTIEPKNKAEELLKQRITKKGSVEFDELSIEDMNSPGSWDKNLSKIDGMTDHAMKRMTERGFTYSEINNIISNGQRIYGLSEYGTKQVIYNLNGNQVVVALEGRNAFKIVTFMRP